MKLFYDVQFNASEGCELCLNPELWQNMDDVHSLRVLQRMEDFCSGFPEKFFDLSLRIQDTCKYMYSFISVTDLDIKT